MYKQNGLIIACSFLCCASVIGIIGKPKVFELYAHLTIVIASLLAINLFAFDLVKQLRQKEES